MLLADGPVRFNALRKEIGTVSQKMLTATLRGLERDGFISRKVTPSIPPKVEYALTDLGRDVLRPLNILANWALQHRDDVARARQAYDQGCLADGVES